MAQSQGSSASLRIGFETGGFGVTGASNYEVPFSTVDIKETQALNESSIMRGTRNPDKAFLGNKSVDGSVSVPVEDTAFAYWLKGFFNSPTTTGSGPYTHVYKINDTTIPSLFVEVGHTDINNYFLHNGIKCNSFDISFGGDGELLANINLLGQKTTIGTSEVLTPSAISTYKKFGQFQASITGATNVKEISLTYTNNLDGEQYVIGDGGIRGDIPIGMVSVSGSFTALYENKTLMEAAQANTDQDFTITLTNGTSVLVFDMEQVTLEAVAGTAVDTPQGLVQTFNYSAFWTTGTNGSALTVSLTNGLATV